ncbi:MAG: hypothetical protein BA865_12385 [Desulfobacterales bacterium S5133MH4]|nr:MAG: hypothetical protein BA865_12385 [Desulfobacterales bacterium S5133MH4]
MANSWVDTITWIGVALVTLVIVGDILLAIFRGVCRVEHEGTTWSELLRESVGTTTLIPWALGVWIGRWFPLVPEPLNSLGTPIALTIVLILTAIITVLGDVLMRRRRRPVIPPWLVALLGLIVGGILLPLPQIY